MNKTCSACKAALSTDLFHKNKSSRDGFACYCKPCMKEVCKRLRATRARSTAAWRAQHPERVVAANKRHYDAHRDKRIQASGDWQKRNPEAAAKKSAARYRLQKQATPTWADLDFINLFYIEVADLSCRKVRGVLHVDHIVPIQSATVCGLHVHANLQMLSESANISKSNKTWPDMF